MSNTEVSIAGLGKAEVLAALYNRAKPQGMGFLHYTPEPMTAAEAQDILSDGWMYFDYLRGRVMKVDLSGDMLDTRLYDRDNGVGAAGEVIATLRAGGSVSDGAIIGEHFAATFSEISSLREKMRAETDDNSYERGIAGDTAVIRLGFGNSPGLRDALDEAEVSLTGNQAPSTPSR